MITRTVEKKAAEARVSSVDASTESGCISSLSMCILSGFSLLTAAMFLGSLFGRYSFWLELLVNFRFQIACLMLVANVCLLLTRKVWISFAYFCLTLWSMSGVFSVYWPTTQPEAGEASVSVMAFNLFNLNSQSRADFEMILDTGPEILLVTEYTDKWTELLRPLNLIYPYSVRHSRWHGYGIALFSKYPLVDDDSLNLTESTDIPMITATIKIDDSELRIIGVHTVSPVSRRRMKMRNQQLELIAQQVPTDEVPTLLLGDFNCVPWSIYMTPIKQTGLRDSRQGFGFHPTWHRRFGPLKIPIDHAFVSRNIHVHRREVGQSFGSDHFPVLLEISISPQTK